MILNKEEYEKKRNPPDGKKGEIRLSHDALVAALMIELYRDTPTFQMFVTVMVETESLRRFVLNFSFLGHFSCYQ